MNDSISPPRIRWTVLMTVQIVVLVAILGFHYRHVVERLIWLWTNNPDWSHGFIIPLFSGYYLYLQRHRIPYNMTAHQSPARIAGAVVLTFAFFLYVFSTLYIPQEYVKGVSLVISIMGMIMMIFGGPIARWSWFGVAFLLFAMPVPQRFYEQTTMPLREIAANVSAAMLSVLPNMMTEAQGTVVEYIHQGRSGVLDVERACSGMRLLVTMTALGVAMAFVNERPLWQRLIMILACVPIAIFCNIIRVTATGFLIVFGHEQLARGFWHTMLGLLMLFVAFSLYGAISYVLNNLLEDNESETPVHGEIAGGVTE